VSSFLQASAFPILAETTSQHRLGASEYASACDVFEPLFGSDDFLATHAPDLVVQVGDAPVGRALGAWIATSGVERIVIASQATAEAFNQASQLLIGDADETLRALSVRLSGDGMGAIDAKWTQEIVSAADTAAAVVDSQLAEQPPDGLTQGVAVRLAVQAVPMGGLLMVGNSMPVRDVDLYCRAAARDIAVLSQRGASGIDGLISGAVGAATASRRPTVLLLGDVSFQHDVGSLAVCREAMQCDVSVTIVVLQNGGGRLFDLLPVRSQPDIESTFERFFLTPTALDIGQAAGSFGVESRRVTEPSSLAESLAESTTRTGVTVIEAAVRTTATNRKR
jgi:2-succinyl-5-enolpyruvyl-6-hydroxy-3-cyclohexene-1-carboxylate synthase